MVERSSTCSLPSLLPVSLPAHATLPDDVRSSPAALHTHITHLSPAVNCHRQEDQSRRDDLWSWFYCLVELVEGAL